MTSKNQTQKKSCFVQTALHVDNELPVRGRLDFYSSCVGRQSWRRRAGRPAGGRALWLLPATIQRLSPWVAVRLWILGMFLSLCDTHSDSASLILQMVKNSMKKSRPRPKLSRPQKQECKNIKGNEPILQIPTYKVSRTSIKAQSHKNLFFHYISIYKMNKQYLQI